MNCWDFPSGPMVKTIITRDTGLIPGRGTDPACHMVRPKKVLKKFSLIIKIWLSKNVIESLFANYSYITTGSDWFLALLANVLVVFKWSEVKVAQLCPTLCDPMDYMVHGILQARKLEWVAFLLWDLPNPGIKPKSPALQAESLPADRASPIKVNFLDCLISLALQRNLLKMWIWHAWFDLSHPHSVDSNLHITLTHFKVALVVKNLPDSAGDIRDLGLIPGSGRSPWKRTWQPTLVFMPSIQAPMNRGAWWAMIHRVTKSQTWLIN